ncbi:MAG: translation elongation factor Ts [Veillonellaceae bacterium]|uniref:translation elongation factor Ts n=1 Tax=Anaerovibrio lipolyticus TaxID=82374 RepID=UPI001F429658|nr:translation elongation factor Ts [Anaerovibrio lipolyticus]MCI6910034.1 translation elongation factor Ts [Veillonellaceae bacterium]MDY4486130.1 translation elongation factor Ts [Anaerovibrio sp.]MCF2601129.1 elongation factor Ts [Anaerovibrio lipolyticus]MCI7077392.1 translation elongation factor Ts [Veillonellaceae bacterium]MCI7091611.1 translation elongation factor Ts [Veillonellaceae bacterium]
MAQITAALVKELREITGAGMMDCKKALVECEGDKDKAIDYLREKGIAKAAKKAGRIASEGVVAAASDGKTACIVEINSETDFVAKNENFLALVKKIAEHIVACKPADMDALNASQMDGKTVAEVMTEAVASIGEKLSLRRFEVYTTEDGQLATYIHMGGKIGVIVELSGGDKTLGKDVAMQIAAAKPQCIGREDVDQEALAHEREVLRKQALEEGKPEKIVEKMVDGRINKYYKEVCLVEQEFVKDSDKTIKDILAGVEVRRFARFEMGEGLEKKNEDFAAEVAAQMK